MTYRGFVDGSQQGRMEGFGQNIAAMRLEGPEISVSSRCESLCLELVENDVERTLLNEETSRLFWQKIKNVEPITTCNGQVWRLSIAPRDGNDVIEVIAGRWAAYSRLFL